MPVEIRDIINGRADGPCAECGKPGRACSRCLVVHYCGPEHQRRHWKRHRAACAPYELRVNEALGRHLVATRDIPAGTVIIRELPIITMPSTQEQQSLFRPVEWRWSCAGCCVGLAGAPTQWLQCRSCGWPLCSETCASAEPHRPECELFNQVGFRLMKADLSRLNDAWQYALGSLRCYLAAPGSEKLRALQDSLRCELAYRYEQTEALRQNFLRNVMSRVKIMRDMFGLRRVPQAGLLSAAYRSIINCTNLSGQEGPYGVQGVLPGISLLEHSCVPSTRIAPLAKEDGFESLVVAIRDIRRGEHLSMGYHNDPFKSTLERRLDVGMGFFLCQCERCRDPTEFGLYVSGWCCSYCKLAQRKAMVVLRDPFSESSLRWSCEHCGGIPSREEVDREVSGLVTELERLEDTGAPIEELDRFIERNLYPNGQAHETHRVILMAKDTLVDRLRFSSLSALYGADSQETFDLLQRRMQLCEELLNVIAVLKSGMHFHRQTLLGSYMEATLNRFQIRCISHGFRKEDAQSLFEKDGKYFMEFKQCLITKEERSVYDGLMNRMPDNLREIYALSYPM